MLRNREVQLLVLILVIISGIGITISAIFLSNLATIIIAVTTALLIMMVLLFTRWRYNELDKLSGYLQQIASGDFQLDVRDHSEGELSILKSQIYKVTKMLSEHGNTLESDKSKLTDAISDISHQLKTPLTSMMVMVELLRDTDLPAEEREDFTRNLQVQLKRMEWLVSTLLKLSKIDAGTITFKNDPIVVTELIDAAMEPLLVPLDIKMQTLDIDGDELATFKGDFNWTQEALINILKNCAEHTAEGGTIRITLAENPLYTEIIIADNGKGIQQEDLPYIFKRFFKGKNADDDSVGIGLAMSHSIITGQQGDLTVQSEPGHGTTFIIKFYKQVI